MDFCAPGKGWEKGSVERGVEYVRGLVFRPIPKVGSFEDLNAWILKELDRDLDRRRLADGRSARDALTAEREHLRPLPHHRPIQMPLSPGTTLGPYEIQSPLGAGGPEGSCYCSRGMRIT